jgi:hypothetical protein
MSTAAKTAAAWATRTRAAGYKIRTSPAGVELTCYVERDNLAAFTAADRYAAALLADIPAPGRTRIRRPRRCGAPHPAGLPMGYVYVARDSVPAPFVTALSALGV